MTEVTKAPLTLAEKVAKYKLIARESLRMQLISARLTRIANLEEQAKATTKCKENIEHWILVDKYELSKLDTEHPDYEAHKKDKEESIKYNEDKLTAHDKELEDIQKLITEQQEGIAKIESGETKVSLEALNALVDEMLTQDALNQTN